jgi:hypothetical protein
VHHHSTCIVLEIWPCNSCNIHDWMHVLYIYIYVVCKW